MKGTRKDFHRAFFPQSVKKKKNNLGVIFSHAFIATLSDTAPLKLKVKWDSSGASLGSFHHSMRFPP